MDCLTTLDWEHAFPQAASALTLVTPAFIQYHEGPQTIVEPDDKPTRWYILRAVSSADAAYVQLPLA